MSVLSSVMVRATRTTCPLWPWTLGTGRLSRLRRTRQRNFTSTSAGRWCSREVSVHSLFSKAYSNTVASFQSFSNWIFLIHPSDSVISVLLKLPWSLILRPWKQWKIQSWPSAHLVAGSWKCPSSAASCVKVGDEYVSLGQVESGPTWDRNVLKLQYTSGQACPDRSRTKTSIIRFKCDKDKVVRDTLFKTNDRQYIPYVRVGRKRVWRDPPLLDSFRDISV